MILKTYENFITAEDCILMRQASEEKQNVQGLDEESTKRFWDLTDTQRAIIKAVEQRYIDSFKDNPQAIFDEVQKVLAAFEKEDYLEWVRINKKHYADMPDTSPYKEYLKAGTWASWKGCFFYLVDVLEHQTHAVKFYGLDEYEVLKAAVLRADDFYKRPAQYKSLFTSKTDNNAEEVEVLQPEQLLGGQYFTALNGRAIDVLAHLRRDDISTRSTLKNEKIAKITMADYSLTYDATKGSIGMNEHKTLKTAAAYFAAANHTGAATKEVTSYSAKIPFTEYAKARKYDVTIHPTDTPEETAAELKRVKGVRKEAAKTFKKELSLLRSMAGTWKEKGYGGEEEYTEIGLIGGFNISPSKDVIEVEFTVSGANYLIKRPLGQYSKNLLGCDGRSPTAYSIGDKLSSYASMDSNIDAGRADRISVKSLLDCTDLPKYKKLKEKKDRHWETKIKEPFETAMETLVDLNVIREWYYTHAKGVELTDNELKEITNYEKFESLYIKFKMTDAPANDPAQVDRRTRRNEEKKQAAATKGKKKKRSKA